jgi:hypothetical protein
MGGDDYEGSNPTNSGNRSDSFDEHSDDDSGSDDIIEIRNASHFDTSISAIESTSQNIVIASSS